jgi:hypothetical protein
MRRTINWETLFGFDERYCVNPSRAEGGLQFRIDLQPPQKSYPLGQPDEVRRSRRFWRRAQPMKARLADRRVNL